MDGHIADAPVGAPDGDRLRIDADDATGHRRGTFDAFRDHRHRLTGPQAVVGVRSPAGGGAGAGGDIEGLGRAHSVGFP